VAVPAPDLAVLRQLGERVRPLSAAAERTLPVPPALAELLPQGALVRGSTVATAGTVATSLALALAGPATVAGSWCAVVGVADLGLVAAAELGVDLGRTLVVDAPGPADWAPVVAALLDAVEVVLVRPGHPITPTTRRRLVARARERGSVLVQVGGRAGVWSERPDLTLTGGRARWEGIGAGHGCLRARRVEVEAVGRRGADRPRAAALWLPGPDGAIARVDPVRAPVPVPAPAPAAAPLRDAG
jgi:hypothetical protein